MAGFEAGFDVQVHHLLAKADLATQRFDLRTHLLDHADQAEGADVRLGHVEDFFGRTGLHKLGQHLAREVARVADLAPQLAVAEGAGAAFAELHVRFGVQHALAPQAPGVLGALAHRLAALQHDGAQAHLGQDQRGKDAAGAEADDHRPRPARGEEVRRGVADRAVGGVGRGADVRVACVARQHGGFVHASGQLHIHRVAQHDGRLLARVPGAPEDTETLKLSLKQAQALQHRGVQRLRRHGPAAAAAR
jgi:hypothetical protein